jgi:hypothetical protein
VCTLWLSHLPWTGEGLQPKADSTGSRAWEAGEGNIQQHFDRVEGYGVPHSRALELSLNDHTLEKELVVPEAAWLSGGSPGIACLSPEPGWGGRVKSI